MKCVCVCARMKLIGIGYGYGLGLLGLGRLREVRSRRGRVPPAVVGQWGGELMGAPDFPC